MSDFLKTIFAFLTGLATKPVEQVEFRERQRALQYAKLAVSIWYRHHTGKSCEDASSVLDAAQFVQEMYETTLPNTEIPPSVAAVFEIINEK